jgi:hypothetical protein
VEEKEQEQVVRSSLTTSTKRTRATDECEQPALSHTASVLFRSVCSKRIKIIVSESPSSASVIASFEKKLSLLTESQKDQMLVALLIGDVHIDATVR